MPGLVLIPKEFAGGKFNATEAGVGFIAPAEGVKIALVHDGGHPVQTEYLVQARVVGLNTALVIAPDFSVAAEILFDIQHKRSVSEVGC